MGTGYSFAEGSVTRRSLASFIRGGAKVSFANKKCQINKMGRGGLHREMTLAEISESTIGGAENVPLVLCLYVMQTVNWIN